MIIHVYVIRISMNEQLKGISNLDVECPRTYILGGIERHETQPASDVLMHPAALHNNNTLWSQTVKSAPLRRLTTGPKCVSTFSLG